MAFKDEARFYKLNGEEYPSVTTALSVVNKPALGPWFAKQERVAFETAMVNLAAAYERKGEAIPPGLLLEDVLVAVKGIKAAEKVRDAAANVGTAAHTMIEWLTRRGLGEDAGPEPVIPDAAMVAVMQWQDWAKRVDFEPLHVEPVVYHAQYGYAGRADVIANILGTRTLADYKSSRAVYPEAHLQITAYRYAAASIGLPTDAGLIVRLPKTLEDPAVEAVPVPDQPLDDFLAALRLWRWMRVMNGQPIGSGVDLAGQLRASLKAMQP
jgi:hypothetical protein